MNSPLSDTDDSAFLFTSEIKKLKKSTCSSKALPLKLKENNNINESINFISNQKQSDCENEKSAQNNMLNELNENFNKEKKERNGKTDAPKVNFALTSDEKLQSSEYKNLEEKKIKFCNTRNFMCPLCLKTFDVESTQVSHMKQCAKKKKMTTKQLLEVLENHKKQLKSKTISSTVPKTYSSSKSKRDLDSEYEDSNSMYQLALGLTLSKSMADNVNLNFNNEQSNKVETHKVTLKKFGFTSSLGSNKSSEKRKLRNLKLSHYSLRERTKEERERLITEKAAMILLTENDELDLSKYDMHPASKEADHFLKNKSEETYLWTIGDNENNGNWYVEELKEILFDVKKSKDNKEDGLSVTSELDKIKNLLVKLNLPRSSISSDWKKLINNKQWSDLTFVSKDLETIYMHSIVLYARCPKALSLDLMSHFSKFDYDIVFLFLQYLYCGVLDGLNLPKIEKLFNLAQAVDYQELIFVLNIFKKNLRAECNKDSFNTTTPDNDLNFSWKQDASKIIQNSSQNVKIDEAVIAERKIIVNNKEIGYKDLEDTVQNNQDSIDQFEVAKHCENKELLHENLKHGMFEDEIKIIGSSPLEKQEAGMEEERDFDKYQDCSQGNYVEKCYSDDEECLIVEESFHKINQRQGENIISNLDLYNQENDMFEDAENLNREHHKKFHVDSSFNTNISPIGFIKKKDEINNMIVSTPSDSSKEVIEEENVPKKCQGSLEMEYEIPFFDPYEHFNSNLTDLHLSGRVEESNALSQPLCSRDLSHSTTKEADSKYFSKTNENPREAEAKSILPTYPHETSDYCFTPTKFSPSRSSHEGPILEKPTAMSTKRRKLCERKILKNSSRLSMKYKFCPSKTRRQRYEMKSRKKSYRGSRKSTEILTKSLLNEFNNSFQSASVTSKTPSPSGSCKNFIEVTPHILPGEEFIENVSPVPDYSIMGASTIKKHLSKYGLKKSLSKKNAKKILRHIYDELHPVLNEKSGKIVKYLSGENIKKDEKKRGEMKIKRNRNIKDREKILGDGRNSDSKIKATEKIFNNSESETDDSSQSSKKGVSQVENDSRSCSSPNLNRSADSEINSSELEKKLSQRTFSDSKEAYTAIYDLIQSDSELRQRIVTYEPIWLEEFQKKLHEKYKKKIKLSDLMDYLDMQCISFRHKNQKRQNLKTRRKSKTSLKKNSV